MQKLRVHNYSTSLDGFAAGPDQSTDDPLGVGGEALHDWVVATRDFQRYVQGQDDATGTEGIDNDFFVAGKQNIGATIMGRNMFGPVRGPWPDESWRGWWGENPPYHHPVFVLTHHPRPSLTMEGGTTFHFVDGSIEDVVEQAFAAADGRDVMLGGGAETVRQALNARLIDDLHFVIAPVLLGSGERLFDGLDDVADAYDCVELVSSPAAVHVRLARKS